MSYDLDRERQRLHAKHHRTGTLNELTYTQWAQALTRYDKHATLKSAPVTTATMEATLTLIDLYIEDGDTGNLLWLMTETERTGITWWNGKDWEWRQRS